MGTCWQKEEVKGSEKVKELEEKSSEAGPCWKLVFQGRLELVEVGIETQDPWEPCKEKEEVVAAAVEVGAGHM